MFSPHPGMLAWCPLLYFFGALCSFLFTGVSKNIAYLGFSSIFLWEGELLGTEEHLKQHWETIIKFWLVIE